MLSNNHIYLDKINAESQVEVIINEWNVREVSLSKEHEKRFRFYQKYKDQLSEAEKIAFDNNKGIPQRFKDIYEAMN